MREWSEKIEIKGKPATMYLDDDGPRVKSEWHGMITTKAKIASGDIYVTKFGPISIISDLGDGMFAFIGSGKHPREQ